MAKSIFCLLLAILMLVLCACSTAYDFHGLDNYFKEGVVGYSSYEIDYFIPHGNRLVSLPYIRGDYHYDFSEHALFYGRNVCDKAILYFQYDEASYTEAKEHCFNNYGFYDLDPSEKCGEYLFYDYYGSRPKDEYYHCDNYPRAFKRIAFSDSDQTIVFLGIYTTDQEEEKLRTAVTDWEGFLEEYFGDYYSFD